MFLIVAIFSFVRGSLFELIGEKVILEMRNELFSKLILKVELRILKISFILGYRIL